MEVKAKWKNGKLYFKNFVVVKEKENFYAVYQNIYQPKEKPITSATTLNQAAKKAKLLQLGYLMCIEEKDDEWKWTV